jgi:thioredoxin 1
MKSKTVITGGLLLFVLASVVTLVLKETRTGEARTATKANVVAPGSGTKLIAYYLHGKVRCVTCNDIETTAKDAVEAGFADELRTGRIEWRVINYEEPGNEHFATDFKLAAPCVVLASVRDGRTESWKSLPEVWELIGDKAAFRGFVQKSVREQLSGQAAERTPAAERSASAPSTTAVPGPLPRLLDLGAGRCIPCKAMAPILEELRKTYQGRLEVIFLDVWENPKEAEKHGVSTIPTQIFFDVTGKELFRHEGFFSREEILAKWREFGVELATGKKS